LSVLGITEGAMLDYLRSIWDYRYFWWNLVKIDLRTRYRGSVLGVGWSLVYPVAMTTMLCVVFHQLFKLPISEYAPYLLAGLSTWTFITTATLQGAHCFFAAEPFIKQYPAPSLVYPLRATIGALFNYGIALVLALLLSVCWAGHGNWLAFLSLGPALVLLFLFCLSLSTIAGYLNTAFQDTGHILDLGFQFLFYATPIMYKPSILTNVPFGWIFLYNPFLIFINLVRLPLAHGQVPPPSSFVAATGFVALALLGVGWTVCKGEKRLVFLV
jgi:lipopolysaccharide transport system permease protein